MAVLIFVPRRYYGAAVDTYELQRETDSFYFINPRWGTRRVAKSQAFLTKADAWRALIAMREEEVSRLEQQLNELRHHITVATAELAKEEAAKNDDGSSQ